MYSGYGEHRTNFSLLKLTHSYSSLRLNEVKMPKYYCEYCDIYLTHSSPVGRRQHIQGRKHISAKIEYFQNLLREEGITPQNFLGFLGNRPYNNSMTNPINNMMHGNFNMYMKYNPMKGYSHHMRHGGSYRMNMSHNKYSRAGYVPPHSSNKFHSNQLQNSNFTPFGNPNSKLMTSYGHAPNKISTNDRNDNFTVSNNMQNEVETSNDTSKNGIIEDVNEVNVRNKDARGRHSMEATLHCRYLLVSTIVMKLPLLKLYKCA
ncbi:RNA-binding protein, putative [Plasmodium ovale curtisi]|uniref:U1 small nuclear ribonucleoprotein C n=1 Tax=Plasmodium ovale curtisi TaxID=864141 RepID=A0A1A8WAQ7_PLAOA|nr:RNA-binding protein, putative [Plasmodium ovale curtisi]